MRPLNEFTLKLGAVVKSKISGFSGVITARSENLNMCNRYFISPKVDKEGKLPDGYWLDEAELEVIEDSVFTPQNQERGGFPSKEK